VKIKEERDKIENWSKWAWEGRDTWKWKCKLHGDSKVEEGELLNGNLIYEYIKSSITVWENIFLVCKILCLILLYILGFIVNGAPLSMMYVTKLFAVYMLMIQEVRKWLNLWYASDSIGWVNVYPNAPLVPWERPDELSIGSFYSIWMV
jgi:hypothetical protein